MSKKAIARLWADYIMSGDRTSDQVPPKLKEDVKKILDEICLKSNR